MTTARPERPISPLLRPIRTAVRSWRLATMRIRLGRRLTVGHNVMIGPSSRLLPPDYLRIGDHVGIGAEFHVEANLVIGSEVLISSRVAIIGRDHPFTDRNTSVYWAGRDEPGLVVIEGDNLIGYGVILIAPAHVGRGCIVGAGAVVVGDLPPDTVCVGVPAKPIRDRYSVK